jgi:glycosyltransferase involved in cell wall biosynthesis
MIHELYPDQFIDSRFVIKTKKKSINTADQIICVSENTKKDLINMYDVPEDKIKVIYHGNSLPKSDEYLKRADLEKMYSITKPFLLYVGDRKRSYKNFTMLFETYSIMFSDRFDLVCFGGGDFNHNELKTIKSIRGSGEVIHLSGSDHLLASLYKNAFCFIYPSLYEGFGIPLLEAMGLGCPAIASNTSSIPEVVDKAALLFDPNSKDSLINVIELLESNESKREKLINLGLEQEKKFSWDKTAYETFKVYEHASDLKH